MSRRLAVAALLLLLALPTGAAELAGVTLPDTATLDGKALVLNGLGLREATFLKVDVYVAGLYLEKKTSNPFEIVLSEGPKRLVLEFVRNVSKDQIVEAWNEGFARNSAKDLPAVRERLALLNSWMKDLTKGSTLAFGFLPGKGVAVEVDGQAKGTIEGSDFARALLSVWLGSSPPNPGLKSGLLGTR